MATNQSNTPLSLIIPQCVLAMVAAWESKELIHIYQLEAPYDAYPGYFFFIWLIPFLWHWTKVLLGKEPVQTQFWLSVLAGMFIGLGRIIEFEFPGQIALTLALGALLPPGRASLLWIACGVCWIHPFKWPIFRTLGAAAVTPIRACLALLSLTAMRPIGKEQFRDA